MSEKYTCAVEAIAVVCCLRAISVDTRTEKLHGDPAVEPWTRGQRARLNPPSQLLLCGPRILSTAVPR